MQGMNEIYAPIYYQFATDTDTDAAMHAEADAFFCFVELISEFRDHFCQHLVSKHCMQSCLLITGSTCHMFHLHNCRYFLRLMDKHHMSHKSSNMQDNSAIGIRATIAQLNSRLQAHDPELWAHLEQKTKVTADMPTAFVSPTMSCVALWCAIDCVMSLECTPAAGQSTVLCVPLDHSAADTRVPVSRCCTTLGQSVQRSWRPHGLLVTILHCHAVKHQRRAFAGRLFPEYQTFAEISPSRCSCYYTSSHAIRISKLVIAVSYFQT